VSFPKQIEELTLDWLSAALRDKGVLTTERLVGFEVEPVTEQGGAGVVCLLRLTYEPDPPGAPAAIFAKFAPADERTREAITRYRLLEREVTFYRRFGDDAGIPVPRCYAAEYDADDQTSLLLLEHATNTCSRDLLEGTPADIEMAVEHLAPFHARWWGREDELGGVYSDHREEFQRVRLESMALALEKLDAGFRDCVHPVALAISERWLAHADAIASHYRSRPQTMCHGSFHRGQLLLPVTEGDPFRVIDWQTVSINSSATDLARIVVAGLLPNQRREHEQALVERYHAILLDHGVAGYSLDELWDDYRLGIAAFIVFHLQALAVYDIPAMLAYWDEQGMRGISLWDLLLNWSGEAAEEHAVVEFLDGVISASA